MTARTGKDLIIATVLLAEKSHAVKNKFPMTADLLAKCEDCDDGNVCAIISVIRHDIKLQASELI